MIPAPNENASGTRPATIAWPDAGRERAFEEWFAGVAERHALVHDSLHLACADASARRYFRVQAQGPAAPSFIVMDSPSAEDSTGAFIHVAGLIQAAGLNGPRVLEKNIAQGFLLLDDLGAVPYLGALQQAGRDDADRLMRDALDALVRWQVGVDPAALPPYDDALLRRELQLFPDWCVEREFDLLGSAEQRTTWAALCDRLVASAE